MVDLRGEFRNRIAEIEQEVNRLSEEKAKVEVKLQSAEAKLGIWQKAHQIETERWGEPGLPLFGKNEKSYRFAAMRLIDALVILKQEQPEITKQQAAEILKAQGFNFGAKKPNRVVHFAWVVLNKRKK